MYILKSSSKIFLLIMMFFFTALNAQDKISHNHHGYVSDVNNKIKALSENEVNMYMEGEGMGLAKAAELNSYPGPKHVLDLSSDLNLNEQQKVETQKLIEYVKTNAVELGNMIVQKESELDSLFKNNSANENNVKETLMEIAELKGELRFVHLNAHLKQKEILYKEQIEKYNSLRGYK